MHLRSSLLALGALPIVAFAQGVLTPPGAPAPSMKSLAELDASLTALGATTDPRVAIETLPGDATALHIISAPGSYCLRGNLTSAANGVAAIRVMADGVVIDLGGFALIGPGAAATASGIDTGTDVAVRRRLVVRNGTLTGWYVGVEGAIGTLAEDLVVENCLNDGLGLGSVSIVRRVAVTSAGARGIWGGVVESCRVQDMTGSNAFAGIWATVVQGCSVENTAGGTIGGYGIVGTNVSNCRVLDLFATSGNAYGIAATTVSGCSVNGVYPSAGAGYGIQGTEVSHCTVAVVRPTSGTGYGITGSSATVTDCTVNTVNSISGISYGISATNASGCYVLNITPSSTAYGIVGARITDCQVGNVNPTSGTGYGIYLSATYNVSCTANIVANARHHGIYVASPGTVEKNAVMTIGTAAGVTDGVGISCPASGSHLVDNRINGGTGCDYGIRVTGSLNFVAGNRCTGSFTGAATTAGGVDTPEFNLVTGNRFGPIVSAFAATGEITATNPFSNFGD